jgi:hypothetical protein
MKLDENILQHIRDIDPAVPFGANTMTLGPFLMHPNHNL